MAFIEMDWQDVLAVAVVATAAGSLALRAYRATKQNQYGASCGACLANSGCPAAGDAGTERGHVLVREETANSTSALLGRNRR